MALDSFFTQLTDATWAAFEDDWRRQCLEFNEDFDGYAVAVREELHEALANPQNGNQRRAGAFALKDSDGTHVAVCQVNVAPIPGYDGPVVRVRFMTIAPKYDFGARSITDYAELVSKMFVATLRLSSEGDMRARHVKFHLPSPADRQFFAILGEALGQAPVFESVEIRGAWLYVTKR